MSRTYQQHHEYQQQEQQYQHQQDLQKQDQQQQQPQEEHQYQSRRHHEQHNDQVGPKSTLDSGPVYNNTCPDRVYAHDQNKQSVGK